MGRAYHVPVGRRSTVPASWARAGGLGSRAAVGPRDCVPWRSPAVWHGDCLDGRGGPSPEHAAGAPHDAHRASRADSTSTVVEADAAPASLRDLRDQTDASGPPAARAPNAP